MEHEPLRNWDAVGSGNKVVLTTINGYTVYAVGPDDSEHEPVADEPSIVVRP